MRIPKQFELMGHTVVVTVVPKEKWHDANIVGEFDPATYSIKLLKTTRSQMEHIFAHELVHAILTAMGHRLNRDEKFVDMFGGLLAQALKTAK